METFNKLNIYFDQRAMLDHNFPMDYALNWQFCMILFYSRICLILGSHKATPFGLELISHTPMSLMSSLEISHISQTVTNGELTQVCLLKNTLQNGISLLSLSNTLRQTCTCHTGREYCIFTREGSIVYTLQAHQRFVFPKVLIHGIFDHIGLGCHCVRLRWVSALSPLMQCLSLCVSYIHRCLLHSVQVHPEMWAEWFHLRDTAKVEVGCKEARSRRIEVDPRRYLFPHSQD